MKKKRFSVEQIVAVLKQAELGVPVAEVIRKVGISEQTFYRWKKQYVGMETDQARPIETWLDSLGLAPKSRTHIRGILSALWNYAMWKQDIPMQVNPSKHPPAEPGAFFCEPLEAA